MKRVYQVKIAIVVDDDDWVSEYGVETNEVSAQVVEDLKEWAPEWLAAPKWSGLATIFSAEACHYGNLREIIDPI